MLLYSMTLLYTTDHSIILNKNNRVYLCLECSDSGTHMFPNTTSKMYQSFTYTHNGWFRKRCITQQTKCQWQLTKDQIDVYLKSLGLFYILLSHQNIGNCSFVFATTESEPSRTPFFNIGYVSISVKTWISKFIHIKYRRQLLTNSLVC